MKPTYKEPFELVKNLCDIACAFVDMTKVNVALTTLIKTVPKLDVNAENIWPSQCHHEGKMPSKAVWKQIIDARKVDNAVAMIAVERRSLDPTLIMRLSKRGASQLLAADKVGAQKGCQARAT